MSTLRRATAAVLIAGGLMAIALHVVRRAPDAPAEIAVARGPDVAASAPAMARRDQPALTAIAPQSAPRDADWPHPITAEHLHIYRDVDMLDAARRALHAHDFERARAILALHRSEQGRASDDMNDGLSLLADCMQYPSAVTRARAQEFYRVQTQSMVRREIRRECLEVVPKQ